MRFQAIPEKPHKTQENREIPVERPVLPVEICSGHQNSLERGLYRGLGLGTSSTVGEKKCWEVNSVQEEDTMAESREVMNIRQASQYLGVSPDTLYKYVNEQEIPAFKLGNRWRFKKSKLDQWMEEKSAETEPQAKKKIKAAMKAAGQQ
jgi:excisionase family DNA binding protein